MTMLLAPPRERKVADPAASLTSSKSSTPTTKPLPDLVETSLPGLLAQRADADLAITMDERTQQESLAGRQANSA